MSFGVIQFPDFDKSEAVYYALNDVLKTDVEKVWYEDLSQFPYEALFVSSGTHWLKYLKIHQIEAHFLEALFNFAEKGGYIFGIGEGFRLLCELQLLPGRFQINKKEHFLSRSIFLKVDNSDAAFTALVDKTGCLKIPLSCYEGRYMANEAELMNMRQNKQILFRYCDDKAHVSEKINYTGSTDNIAAIRNNKGNVYGILPSIELAVDDFTGNSDGRYIFESILAWIR